MRVLLAARIVRVQTRHPAVDFTEFSKETYLCVVHIIEANTNPTRNLSYGPNQVDLNQLSDLYKVILSGLDESCKAAWQSQSY